MAIDWVFSHRPTSFDDMALYPEQRERLEFYADMASFPHLLLAGNTGTGKTTTAHIFGALTDHSVVEHNCAKDNSKEDMLKIEKTGFSVLGTRRRCFIMDEFHAVAEPNQRILNKTMEDLHHLNVFIFCVNDIHKISDPIASRCTTINFDVGVIHPKTYKLKLHSWVDMTKDEWIIELQRITRLVAKKNGYEDIDEHLDKVAADDRYLVDARKYISEVEQQIKMHERKNAT